MLDRRLSTRTAIRSVPSSYMEYSKHATQWILVLDIGELPSLTHHFDTLGGGTFHVRSENPERHAVTDWDSNPGRVC